MSDAEASSVCIPHHNYLAQKEGYRSRCDACGAFYWEIPDTVSGCCSSCFSRNSVVPLRPEDHQAVGISYFMKHRWGSCRLVMRIGPQSDEEFDDTGVPAPQNPLDASVSSVKSNANTTTMSPHSEAKSYENETVIPVITAKPTDSTLPLTDTPPLIAKRKEKRLSRRKETTTCGHGIFGAATPLASIGRTTNNPAPNIFGACTNSPLRISSQHAKGRGGNGGNKGKGLFPPLNPLASVPGFTSEKVLLELVEKRLKMWDDTPDEEIFGGYKGGGAGGIPLGVVCGFLPKYWMDLEEEL